MGTQLFLGTISDKFANTHIHTMPLRKVCSQHFCVCVFVCICECVFFVPFLETTAVYARYPHNVGQVYNMVIRDLRVCFFCVHVCVCVYVSVFSCDCMKKGSRDRMEEEKKKKREKQKERDDELNFFIQFSLSVFRPKPVYCICTILPDPQFVCMCVCVSEWAVWTRSASSVLPAPQRLPHYSP